MKVVWIKELNVTFVVNFLTKTRTHPLFKRKDVTTETFWRFEMAVQSGFDDLIYVIVGFKQQNQLNQQQRKAGKFFRPTLVNAQCIIGSRKDPAAATDCYFGIGNYSQSKGENVTCFWAFSWGYYITIIYYTKSFYNI